jgi:hypothetical protein
MPAYVDKCPGQSSVSAQSKVLVTAGDSCLPVLVLRFAAGLGHGRVPPLVLRPVAVDVVFVFPEADGQVGVGGAERGGLVDHRADHRHLDDVLLELHQQLVDDPCRRRP